MISSQSAARCYLDANVFIMAHESADEYAIPLLDFLRTLKSHPKQAVTSELTLAELLAPQKLSQSAAALPLSRKSRFYLGLLVWQSFIDLRPVSRDVLIETADLRARLPRRIKLPDAIHMVTAIQTHCSFLMSNDKDLSTLPDGMTWLRPDTNGIATILKALDA